MEASDEIFFFFFVNSAFKIIFHDNKKVLFTTCHLKGWESQSHDFGCSPALFYACIVRLWQQIAYQHLMLD